MIYLYQGIGDEMEERIVFKGKISIWYYVIVILYNMFFLLNLFFTNTIYVLILVIIYLLGNLLFLPQIFVNRVELFSDYFIFYFGFSKKKIKLDDITVMHKTNDFTSSSACSLDRIYIDTINSDFMISLNENDAFIDEVKERCPLIKFK